MNKYLLSIIVIAFIIDIIRKYTIKEEENTKQINQEQKQEEQLKENPIKSKETDEDYSLNNDKPIDAYKIDENNPSIDIEIQYW